MYFSTPGYAVLYGYNNYILGGEILIWISLLAISGSIFALANSIAMAVRLRRKSVIILLLGLIIKLSTTYHFIYIYGYPGAALSSFLSAFVIFVLTMYVISKTYQINFTPYLLNLAKIALGIVFMVLAAKALELLGLKFYYQSQMKDLITLAIYGVVVISIYLIVTYLEKLPQEIFKIDLKNLFKRR